MNGNLEGNQKVAKEKNYTINPGIHVVFVW